MTVENILLYTTLTMLSIAIFSHCYLRIRDKINEENEIVILQLLEKHMRLRHDQIHDAGINVKKNFLDGMVKRGLLTYDKYRDEYVSHKLKMIYKG